MTTTVARSVPKAGSDHLRALAVARPFATRIWRSCRFVPHAAQGAVLLDNSRHRVVDAGRRLGKSEIGAAELDAEVGITKMMLPRLENTDKRCEFWIVGPNYTDAEKEFRKHWNAIKAWGIPMDKPGSYYDAHSGDMQMSLFGGKYLVLGKSAAHPERLIGEGLSGVIMAEAAKQKESTWSKYIRPTLADFTGWSIHSSTPEGKNWFHENWVRGQDETNPDWSSWRMPAWLNPYVYPLCASDAAVATLRAAIEEGGFNWHALVKRLGIDPEIASLVRDLGEIEFNQEIGADFSEFVGLVFADFDEEVHVKNIEYDSRLPLYAACDYGFTNPFVWLLIQVDVFDNVYVIDEFYQSGLTIDEIALELDSRDLAPSNIVEFYPDPASPGDTLALSKHLRLTSNNNTGGELSTRLRYIRNALKVRRTDLPFGHMDRQPKLFINRKCTDTIREFNSYRYPDKRAASDKNHLEQPLKKDDHTPEALGRFYYGHYGEPEFAAGTTQVRKGKFNNKGQ